MGVSHEIQPEIDGPTAEWSMFLDSPEGEMKAMEIEYLRR